MSKIGLMVIVFLVVIAVSSLVIFGADTTPLTETAKVMANFVADSFQAVGSVAASVR